VALIEAIVYMPWTTSPDESFVKSYIEFIGMLVTARAEWRGIVVASAARRLTHRGCLFLLASLKKPDAPL
jgi:RNA polymerase I-specific transcription initiation factor RRN3